MVGGNASLFVLTGSENDHWVNRATCKEDLEKFRSQRGLEPMTVRVCCNALPSQPSEIHVYSMSAQRTHFQLA